MSKPSKTRERSADDSIALLQTILFPDAPDEWDGVWGKKSQAALDALLKRQSQAAKWRPA